MRARRARSPPAAELSRLAPAPPSITHFPRCPPAQTDGHRVVDTRSFFVSGFRGTWKVRALRRTLLTDVVVLAIREYEPLSSGSSSAVEVGTNRARTPPNVSSAYSRSWDTQRGLLNMSRNVHARMAGQISQRNTNRQRTGDRTPADRARIQETNPHSLRTDQQHRREEIDHDRPGHSFDHPLSYAQSG